MKRLVHMCKTNALYYSTLNNLVRCPHYVFCRYWVFRSWGRVGTTIGSNKLEEMSSKEEAIDHFLNLYQEKTGNAWHSTNFNKYPNKFYPLEIDYGQVSVQSDILGICWLAFWKMVIMCKIILQTLNFSHLLLSIWARLNPLWRYAGSSWVTYNWGL